MAQAPLMLTLFFLATIIFSTLPRNGAAAEDLTSLPSGDSNSKFSQLYRVLTPKTPPQTQIDTVKGLIGRLLGTDSVQYFDLKIVSGPTDGDDVFDLSSSSGMITISGSTGVALASGFNWYLKYYLNSHVSWGRDGSGNQISIPNPLPPVTQAVHKQSLGKFRYYMNICTLSYSSAWWDWSRWEQELDWMALNAINMPLSFTGQEYVWQLALKKLGFTQQEITDFFAGPAFLAWGRMGNIKKWGGPLPQGWINDQYNLQQQILARARDFGMVPVLPAFAGHVPDAITRIFPNANVTASSEWNGFSSEYSEVLLLEPLDPLFQQFGKLYLDTQTSVYGTDHIYNADTYNELEPQSNDPGYLKLSSAAVYKAMVSSDANAIWLMQGWLFLDTNFWGPQQVQGYLSGVPDNSMIILDLDSLREPQWSRLESYYGKPWIWCLLHNFGGNRRIYGNLQQIATVPFVASTTPGNTMIGTGLTPEAIEQNPVVYELMSEVTWYSAPFSVKTWITQYIQRRYGVTQSSQEYPYLLQSWNALLDGVYNITITDEYSRNVFDQPPTVERKMTKPTDYSTATLIAAARALVTAGSLPNSKVRGVGPYNYDLVDVVRELLSDVFYDMYGQLYGLYQVWTTNQIDTSQSVQAIGDAMTILLNDLDAILQSNVNYLVGTWINDAMNLAQNYSSTEKLLMAYNARNQITLWGPDGQINDYASKHWSGLVSTYYLPRWTMLVSYVKFAIQADQPVDWATFYAHRLSMDQRWNALPTNTFPITPSGNSVALATAIVGYYTSHNSNYTVYNNADSPGNDITQTWTTNLAQLKQQCDINPSCLGFNANGWLKHSITIAQRSGSTLYVKAH